MQKILVIGGTSAIAESTARLFAERGDAMFLTARNPSRLEAVASDLRVRGAAKVTAAILEAADYDRHEAVIEEAHGALGGLDAVLIAHGTLPDQRQCEISTELTRAQFETNALSVISLLTHLANRFEEQGHGTLAVISSVAGDRGRQSNYVYGAAKAAIDTFMEGLRNRLFRSGVRVLTIKPGLVDTPMTTGFRKNFLWAKPERVGRGIFKAMDSRSGVVYLPWFWRPIMELIRAIPEAVFKRIRL